MRIEELSMGSANSPSGAAVDTLGTFVTLLLYTCSAVAGEPSYISVGVAAFGSGMLEVMLFPIWDFAPLGRWAHELWKNQKSNHVEALLDLIRE